MKIILSRKGFDAGAGKYPSPFLVNEGKLLSLPIPEENKIYTLDTGRLYSDLLFENDTTYLDIMEQLGMKGFEGKNAHLDPDINQNILSSRKSEWKGMFGQCDAAQGHLFNNGIQSGDLFLFFGWFKDVVKIDGKYEYVSGTDKHIIWGYMQVGVIDNISEAKEYEPWKLDHPHYRNKDRNLNTCYIARDSLDFKPEIPGWGVLNYNDSLVLTDSNQKNKRTWRLPEFFHPYYGTSMTCHENIFNKGNKRVWEAHDDHCILHSVCRGQEFVITGNDKVVEWAKNLILNSKISQSESYQTDSKLIFRRPESIEDGQKEKGINDIFQPMFANNSNTCPTNLREDNKHFNFEVDNIVSMVCYRNATNEIFTVKFDLEDLDKVKQFDKWKVEKSNNKAYANIGTENTYLHRLIYGDCKGKKVLVKNGNYLDCRRENLYAKP
jgi:hypothetical protein